MLAAGVVVWTARAPLGALGVRRVDLPYDDAVPASAPLSPPRPPTDGDDWTALADQPLPVGDAYAWAVRPDCGAVVVFTGTARDHSDGRPGVSELAYEAYEEQAVPRMRAVVAEMRRRWALGRVAVVHRVGDVPISQEAVLVVVSGAHRAEAFAAARFGIDAVKASVPVWKRERWDGGEGWGLEAQHLVDPASLGPVDAGSSEDALGRTGALS